MLPTEYSDDLQVDFTVEPQATRTYRLNFNGNPSTGMLDGLEAVKQTVYMILHCERYVYEMFSWNYGVELWSCFQESDMLLTLAKIETSIRDALMQDDRITAVNSFSFEREKNRLHVTFTVVSTEGNITSETVFGDDGTEVLLS